MAVPPPLNGGCASPDRLSPPLPGTPSTGAPENKGRAWRWRGLILGWAAVILGIVLIVLGLAISIGMHGTMH